MSRVKPNLPASFHNPTVQGICRWCAKPIYRDPAAKLKVLNKRRVWHKECVHEYLIISHPSYAARMVAKRDKGVCAKCKRVNHDWQMDHIFALWKSGGDLKYFRLENLQTLCRVPCHSEKTKADTLEFRQRRKVETSKIQTKQ